MKHYKFTRNDFKKAFEFGVNYYIAPFKNVTGRTTNEPRGLGAVLDAFTIGKLTEIGVEKILKKLNKNKVYVIDFDIKKDNQAMHDPDIPAIKEKGVSREPNYFVEIKTTFEKDRWIGVTEDQFATIKGNAKGREIFLIYASIHSQAVNNNPKTTDLAGMFFKEIENQKKSKIFQEFADLNACCKIEFILSSNSLEKLAYPFKKGMNIYETNLFQEKKRTCFYSKKGTRKDVLSTKEYKDFKGNLRLEIGKGKPLEDETISTFKVLGTFKIISKKSKTSIECTSDVFLENNVFGEFHLEKGKFYSFNIETIGRNPKLQRNNLFLCKRRIYQLIQQGKIEKPEKVIQKIAKNI